MAVMLDFAKMPKSWCPAKM